MGKTVQVRYGRDDYMITILTLVTTFRIFSENRQPQFLTPHKLLGIFNESLRVHIKAEDPEGEKITFTLLDNGTISPRSASITKDGLIDIPLSKRNGTVFVQVEDVMGGRNILILHVNAMQCPCEHDGRCEKNKTVEYPTKPSDYLCKCKVPYSGSLCEIRPNPCDEQPCYSGLKCSSAKNSEGFTCEECPPLFEGDGKTCELDTTKGMKQLAKPNRVPSLEINRLRL